MNCERSSDAELSSKPSSESTSLVQIHRSKLIFKDPSDTSMSLSLGHLKDKEIDIAKDMHITKRLDDKWGQKSNGDKKFER